MIWMVKFYHLENSGKSFFGFWLSFKVHSNLILLKSLLNKIKKKKQTYSDGYSRFLMASW